MEGSRSELRGFVLWRRRYCWLQPVGGGSLGRTTDGARAEVSIALTTALLMTAPSTTEGARAEVVEVICARRVGDAGGAEVSIALTTALLMTAPSTTALHSCCAERALRSLPARASSPSRRSAARHPLGWACASARQRQ